MLSRQTPLPGRLFRLVCTMPHKPIDRENDPRWERLGAYIRDLMDRMGLSRYHFDLSHKPPDGPSGQVGNAEGVTAAHVYYAYGCLKCEFCFGDIFFEDYCPEEQRHAVVHEIVHVLQAGSAAHLDQLRQEDGISIAVWDIWWKTYHFISEREVDWIASLIAPQYPLIDWGEL